MFCGNTLLSPDRRYRHQRIKVLYQYHSNVQPYISAHPMIDKKKPFFQGYRIEIFSGNSKEEARKLKHSDSKFSSMRCYLTYQQPYYKLRVGDYEDQESAKLDAKKLARTYPSSFLVPDEVRRTGSSELERKKIIGLKTYE